MVPRPQEMRAGRGSRGSSQVKGGGEGGAEYASVGQGHRF